jgi:predicted RNase H-like HicB family nuclease
MSAVSVLVHSGEGSWWADSPELPGLSIAADSLAELRALIAPAVAFHLESDEEPEIVEVLVDDLSVSTPRDRGEG